MRAACACSNWQRQEAQTRRHLESATAWRWGGAACRCSSQRTLAGASQASTLQVALGATFFAVVSSVVSQRCEREGEFGCAAMATHRTLRCKLAQLCQHAERLHIYVVCASFTSETLARACAPKGRNMVVHCTPRVVAEQLVLRHRKAALARACAPKGRNMVVLPHRESSRSNSCSDTGKLLCACTGPRRTRGQSLAASGGARGGCRAFPPKTRLPWRPSIFAFALLVV